MNKITLTKQIEKVLIKHPETRNNDIDLMLMVWQEFYPNDLNVRDDIGVCVQLSAIHRLPREDHVKRIRAKFQNDLKKYLPTDPEVAKKRGWAEEEWRSLLAYPPMFDLKPVYKVNRGDM